MVMMLTFLYATIMAVLILAVIDEPISGVVILIFGVPITAVYIIVALIATLTQNSGPKTKSKKEVVGGSCSIEGCNRAHMFNSQFCYKHLQNSQGELMQD